MKKVAIYTKPTESLREPLSQLIGVLEKAGFSYLLDERASQALDGLKGPGHPREELARLCQIGVVLGGDGTMLGVARDTARFSQPLVGVNAGRLGFITDIPLDQMPRMLPAVLSGKHQRDRRHLLVGSIIRSGTEIYAKEAVNDLGLSHGKAGGMVEFAIYVNGQPMSRQSADGIICATPTGSTAYALAAGGPILHPSLQGVTLVPVAPHTLSNRPIVLPEDATIDIKLVAARDAVAYFDMQEFFDVMPGDVLRIHVSDLCIEILHPMEYDYFELLRRKLKWNFMPAGGDKKDSALS